MAARLQAESAAFPSPSGRIAIEEIERIPPLIDAVIEVVERLQALASFREPPGPLRRAELGRDAAVVLSGLLRCRGVALEAAGAEEVEFGPAGGAARELLLALSTDLAGRLPGGSRLVLWLAPAAPEAGGFVEARAVATESAALEAPVPLRTLAEQIARTVGLHVRWGGDADGFAFRVALAAAEGGP